MQIELSKIREPRQTLRGAEKHNPNYADLRESIREWGVLVPILVRPDSDNYIIIDGTQRYNLSRETGKDTIPVRVLSVDEATALEIQIITNLQRVETTPTQYAEQLRLMMALNPELSTRKLAVKLNKSPVTIQNMLGLTNLIPEIAEIVDQREMPVANAQALSRLPADKQKDYLSLALELQPREFAPRITEVVRQIREKVRTPRIPKNFHVDRYQRMSEIKAEIDEGKIARLLLRGSVTPKQAFRLALEWVLHRDPVSRKAAEKREKARRDAGDKIQKDLEEERNRRTDSAFNGM